MNTRQTVQLESKEGKALLRRIKNRWPTEDWTAIASHNDDWKLTFRRYIPAKEAGDPDEEVNVKTDFQITPPPIHVLGDGKPFQEAENVFLPEPKWIHLHGDDAGLLAKLLLDGATQIEIDPSRGSTNSSHLGLGFFRLKAMFRKPALTSIQIGCETITHHGRQIVSGVVQLSTM